MGVDPDVDVCVDVGADDGVGNDDDDCVSTVDVGGDEDDRGRDRDGECDRKRVLISLPGMAICGFPSPPVCKKQLHSSSYMTRSPNK